MLRSTSATIIGGCTAALLEASAGPARSETADHLQCYKIKDPSKIGVHVDLDSEQFGLDPGCEIRSKGKFFCAPVTKAVTAIDPNSTVDPKEHMHGPDAGDRICYKAKCPAPETPIPELVRAADQFGMREIERSKTQLVCTPAVKVLPGWLGRTEIVTLIETGMPPVVYVGDQYWLDTDGVAPEIPGCHYPYMGKDVDTDLCTGPFPGLDGVFGEFCNPAAPNALHQPGFAVGSLIESNPAASVCHPHKDMLGHPDVYDCDAYCKGTYTPAHTGTCVADVCAFDMMTASARCSCVPPPP